MTQRTPWALRRGSGQASRRRREVEWLPGRRFDSACCASYAQRERRSGMAGSRRQEESLADRAEIQAAQVGFFVLIAAAMVAMVDEARLPVLASRETKRPTQPVQPGTFLLAGWTTQCSEQSLKMASRVRRDALRDRLLGLVERVEQFDLTDRLRMI